jgi:hypothetical protein
MARRGVRGRPPVAGGTSWQGTEPGRGVIVGSPTGAPAPRPRTSAAARSRTASPFGTVVRNDMDRHRLVTDVVDRVRGPAGHRQMADAART